MAQRVSIPPAAAAGAALLLLALAFQASRARAYWPLDGRSIGISGSQQLNPAMVGDDNGGAILFWADDRGFALRLSMHHLLADGNLDSRIPVPGQQFVGIPTSGAYLAAVRDGSGGAIAVWQEMDAGGHNQIHALRVDSGGSIVAGWPDTAATASAATQGSGASAPAAVTDGAGGVVIAWQQANSDSFGSYDIWAQRLTAAGAPAPGWAPGGEAICSLSRNQYAPRISTDGAGGAIVCWLDQRAAAQGQAEPVQLYAQHVRGSGAVAWAAGGVAVRASANDISDVDMVRDSAGGAVISYSEALPSSVDLFAQRVDSLGVKQWGAGGVTVCNAAFDQNGGQIAGDSQGGYLVTWYDGRSAGDTDIYGQRLSHLGAAQWTANGALVCGATAPQEYPQVVADGTGGALIAWVDIRNNGWDLYAQKMTSGGSQAWATNGVPLCQSLSVDLGVPPQMVSDGSGGALAAWLDHRLTPGVYAARVNNSGVTGPLPVTVSAVEAVASAGAVNLSWAAYVDGTAKFGVFRSAGAAGPFALLDAAVTQDPGGPTMRARDASAEPDHTYFYKIGWNEAGAWQYSGILRVPTPAAMFGLRAAVPNPARDAVRIDYELDAGPPARLDVCDASGRRLLTLLQLARGAGLHSVTWDGRLASGSQASAGVYFLRLTSGTRTATRRIVHL